MRKYPRRKVSCHGQNRGRPLLLHGILRKSGASPTFSSCCVINDCAKSGQNARNVHRLLSIDVSPEPYPPCDHTQVANEGCAPDTTKFTHLGCKGSLIEAGVGSHVSISVLVNYLPNCSVCRRCVRMRPTSAHDMRKTPRNLGPRFATAATADPLVHPIASEEFPSFRSASQLSVKPPKANSPQHQLKSAQAGADRENGLGCTS